MIVTKNEPMLEAPQIAPDTDLTEEEMVKRAKRSQAVLKRHKTDFAKVASERIRMLDKFIGNPRRLSAGMMRIIIQPLDGL